MLLFAMRLRGFTNDVKRKPARYIFGLVFMSLLYWGVFAATRWGIKFIARYPDIGTIKDAIMQRSLEALFLMLTLGVAFSVLTTAITTLYSSEDLPFLLSLPVPPERVFYLKVAETYINAALMPAVFTLPILIALGLEFQAPATYYLVAIAALLTLYAIPVALGGVLALILMRIAPAGRVKELATAISVVLAAGMIFALRAIRPEQLTALSPAEFTRLLGQFASFELTWLPTSWVSQAAWAALEGRIANGAYILALVSSALLFFLARLAAFAYREGWIRSLDSGFPKLDPTVRPIAWWEKPLYKLGRSGGIMAKDNRLLFRDPTQWSQLLVLVALAGVYLVSTGSIRVPGDFQSLKDAVGTMNLMFLGFMLAGVGIRTAYPIVSMEAEGFWMLRTGPLNSWQIVWTKFINALPLMIILGFGLGLAAAFLIDVSPTLAFASPIAGLCAGIATTGLGVGIGAAFPRFDAANSAEIPVSAGGFLYMTFALAYAALMTTILAYPAWQAIQLREAAADFFYWSQPQSWLILLLMAVITIVVTVMPLVYGSRRLARYEPGD